MARVAFIPYMVLTYDEAAYSFTAWKLANNGGWLSLYGNKDLFFFPPFFNYIAAVLIKSGVDRLYAVRFVSALFSSGILPLIYLLMVRSGHTVIAAFTAALLWFILPGGYFYSVVGTVETTMLFFMLLSAYFMLISISEDSRRLAVFSAAGLALAIWTKETMVGIIPFFLLIIFIKARKHLAVWIAVFCVMVMPLALQSLLPHDYDLFFEITAPMIIWNSISFDAIILNIADLNGLRFNSYTGFRILLTILILFTVILSFIDLKKEDIKRSFIFQFALGGLLIYVPFFIFFPKKFPYYLLPVCLFISFFMAEFFSRHMKYGAIYIVIAAGLSFVEINQLADRSDELWYKEAFRMAIMENKDAKVATPLPRKAEYIAQNNNIPVNIVPTEWLDCYGRGRECIFRNDFFMADDNFLQVLFCKTWPMTEESCNKEDLAYAREHLQLINRWPDFSLYRIIK